MKKVFNELSKKTQYETEQEILKKWQDNNLLEKTIENREKEWVFYDGPATANGNPGVHHMVAKFLKDAFCKYQTMKGNKVLRKIGWDTHGLPVEVQVEKELGLPSYIDDVMYEKFIDLVRLSGRTTQLTLCNT